MLIRIDHGRMSINNMWRLVLKWVFNRDACGESDLFIINSNIEKWYKVVKEYNVKLEDAFGDAAFQEAVGRRGSVCDEIEYQLIEMSKMLVADEDGKLDYKKETFRNHKIDYRKCYLSVFPEMAPTKKDKARAQSFLEINKKENPDVYNKN